MTVGKQARRDGNPLENAVQHLIEIQAIAQMQMAKADERFSRHEELMASILRILERLPDAVRERIGFSPPKA